ncbi:uncharacterized protein UV8b_00007 [Ustilaginoidea virens]|uniref:Uncharacterized protein n=1 Tax=Ustilaginoidea virens TaxID=1159556 RepID=A0A8E5MD91_USTVR|nr:uncharacterized protein UV8b_00007 [Ustilaginoidea virens]QUC15766.1 hypothetical protein UV8b_00007 [Ustilaginoidea virens]
MQSQFFGQLKAGDQFRAIEGVVHFFMANSLGGASESWISYVDAGIIEAIQRGGAIALGLPAATYAGKTGGANQWASFPSIQGGIGFANRNDHDRLWSVAEQAATEYGARLADAKFKRSAREQSWFECTQLFRWIMRNREATYQGLKSTAIGPAAWAFINWMTDVTDVKPGKCLTEVAWFYAGVESGTGGLAEVARILPRLLQCFGAAA